MKLKAIALSFLLVAITFTGNSQQKFWELAWLRYQVSQSPNGFNIKKIDWDRSVRLELSKQSDAYIKMLEDNRSFLYAPELEDYMHQKLYKIYPAPFFRNNYAVIKGIRVVNSSVPDAQILSNGQMLITTGLLTLVETEDELTAIIAQQVARFVLDMNYETYKAGKSNGWGAFFIGLTAQVVTNVALNKKHDDYFLNSELSAIAGDATMYMTNSLFNAISKAHSNEQAIKADSLVLAYMDEANFNKKALATAMSKVYAYANKYPENTEIGFLSDYERIPKRLKKNDLSLVEKKDTVYDLTYTQHIAEAILQNTLLLVGTMDYAEAIRNADRLIDNGLAYEDTYLLKAMALRNLPSNTDNNQAILNLLKLADSKPTMKSEYVDIERGLIYLRMNNKPEALSSFLTARRKINEMGNPSYEQLSWLNKIIGRCSL